MNTQLYLSAITDVSQVSEYKPCMMTATLGNMCQI